MQDPEATPRDDAVQRLFDALVVLGRAFKSGSSAYDDPELSRGDIHALGVIATYGPCRSGHVAEILCVDRSVVSRQLATLAHIGLVDRAADPDDGRAELVSLTAAGRQRLVHTRDSVCAELGRRLEPWDTAGLDQLTVTLTELAHSLQQPSAPSKKKETHV